MKEMAVLVAHPPSAAIHRLYVNVASLRINSVCNENNFPVWACFCEQVPW